MLLYATEACPFLARDQSLVSFAMTRVFFRTRFRDVTDQCQIMFSRPMLLVEHHVFLRKVRFLLRFKNSDNLMFVHYFSTTHLVKENESARSIRQM